MRGHDVDHLKNNQIFQAIVDEKDLFADQQVHLNRCQRCRSEKTRLETELYQLGQLAEKHAPKNRRQVVLAKPSSRFMRSTPRFWKMSLATAVSLAFLTVTIWWFSDPQQMSPPINGKTVQTIMANDAQFMLEIGKMVENALPEVYFQILGENDSIFHDTFMEFMIPSTENDAITYYSVQKGRVIC
jgi:hypothetical protein